MDPFIGQIMMFGGNFAPRGWALCDGQLLAISSNSALFSILGTTYGGDGRTTFGLPDLRGRFPLHPGNGPGLSPVNLGQKRGSESVTLSVNNLPAHNHPFTFTPNPISASMGSNSSEANTDDPDGAYPAVSNNDIYSDSADGTMSAITVSGGGGTGEIGFTGNGVPVSTVNPGLGVNFIIALQGVYPSRN